MKNIILFKTSCIFKDHKVLLQYTLALTNLLRYLSTSHLSGKPSYTKTSETKAVRNFTDYVVILFYFVETLPEAFEFPSPQLSLSFRELILDRNFPQKNI